MIKSINSTINIALLFLQIFVGTAQGVDTMNREISLAGQHLKVLEDAATEFRKKGLDILKYKVSLYREGTSYLVMFEDPEISESQRGSSPRMPSFEVEIDSDFQVVRANFSR